MYHIFKQMVTQGILKYCLHDFLGHNQRKAVFKFFDVCANMLAEKHTTTDLPQLLQEVNNALAELERHIPITIQVSEHTYIPFY